MAALEGARWLSGETNILIEFNAARALAYLEWRPRKFLFRN
jgi:hypothetical protein